MSHPVPGHDYSEQTKHESNSEYKGRRAKALEKVKGKKLKVKSESGERIIPVFTGPAHINKRSYQKLHELFPHNRK